MYLTGFTDEVSNDIDRQIEVCKALGWSYIDLRTIGDHNIVDLPDDQFDDLVTRLDQNRLSVNSFGSPIANWSRRVGEPFHRDEEDLARAIPRMRRLSVKHIRVMSYRADESLSDANNEREIVSRLRRLARTAEDEGVVLLHENCETWGGQSYEHTERLIDGVNSPAFKLVFDTGNPPGTLDHRPDVPAGAYQDALSFYRHIKQHVAAIHIKDARVVEGEVVYTYPGEGTGRVPEIIRELRADRFDGPISIEPHLAVVYHDPRVTSNAEERWNSFVEYARRTESLLEDAGFSVGAKTVP